MKTTEDIITALTTVPEDNWTTGILADYHGRCCAIGHINRLLGGSKFRDDRARTLINDLGIITKDLVWANDGNHTQFDQPTPKQRTLAFLKSIQ